MKFMVSWGHAGWAAGSGQEGRVVHVSWAVLFIGEFFPRKLEAEKALLPLWPCQASWQQSLWSAGPGGWILPDDQMY